MLMRHTYTITTLVLLFITACGSSARGPKTSVPPRTPVTRATVATDEVGRLAERSLSAPEALPLVAARIAQVDAALASSQPILTLDGLDPTAQQAQEQAVRDPRVRTTMRTNEGQPMRAEVFGVYPLSPADITTATAVCQTSDCYRVELYNFGSNQTVLAVVDPATDTVIDVNILNETQPTVVPQHLMDLAAEIALAAPEVRAELGLQPDAAMIQQPQMKVQFQATACERSRHLCVAPIFVWGERALWVIVDVTDYTIIGLRWTDLGASSRMAITEQRLQDEVVTRLYCEQTSALTRDGWDLNYILTSSDGLEIRDVQFNGTPVLRSAKLVDIHINYSSIEGFGYSDALGCPVFSAAAVVAWNGPHLETITASDGTPGFALIQRFRSEFWPVPCNYAYQQRYEFYADGRFRPVFVIDGRGCGNDGTYRPIMRIAPALEQARFAEWTGRDWQLWSRESWQLQQPTTAYTAEGYQYRLDDGTGNGWYIEPGQGQFGDSGRGDNAYLYVSRVHADRDEGESDMPTLGDCCNTDERQGPERFIDPPDALGDAPVVLWYVPQLKNSDEPGAEYCWADAVLEDGVFVPQVWPCAAGPMFVPVGR